MSECVKKGRRYMVVEVKQGTEQTETQLLNELSSPQVQEALVALIHKLPQIKEAVDKAEQGIAAVTHLPMGLESLNYLAERADQVSKLALNKENLEALGVIIDKLPTIAKTMALLDRITPFLEFVGNEEFVLALSEVFGVVTAPVKERVQDGISMVKEAKERAARNDTNLSIFGLLKMLKDPAVQNGIKFSQALMDVVAERKTVK
jgi:uncharacterized protein YjgD (DUF1641 family)